MRQNTLRTTHVPKPIIVNQAAYRAAVERRVERYGLVPPEWHAPVVRLVCRAATHSWHVMRPVVEPEPNDPDWVAARLREGKLVWRLGMDRTCVAWPVRAICRTVENLLHASKEHNAKVNKLADRALASARHGDVAVVLRVEKELGELRQRAELDADLDRRLCSPATVVVGPALMSGQTGQLVWHRCTTLRAISDLGTVLDNCLSSVNRSPYGSLREAVLAEREQLWGLHDGERAVAAASCVRNSVWFLREVLGPRNVDVEARYRAAIAALWSWHAAHEQGPHEPDWKLAELRPSSLKWPHGTHTEMRYIDGRFEEVMVGELNHDLQSFEHLPDPCDLVPSSLRDTSQVRQALRAFVDPARDWALDPPRLDARPAVDLDHTADGNQSLAA